MTNRSICSIGPRTSFANAGGLQDLPVSLTVPEPSLDERCDVSRQLGPRRGAMLPCEVPEVPRDRDARMDVSRAVATLGQPGDVLLAGLDDPRGTDLVDGGGTEKVALQQNKLLSAPSAGRSSSAEAANYVAIAILIKPFLLGHDEGRPHNRDGHISMIMWRTT
jgi:hypothetical protein